MTIIDDYGEIKAAGRKLTAAKCGHFVCTKCFDQLTAGGDSDSDSDGYPAFHATPTFTCPSCRKKQPVNSAITLYI